MTLILRQDEVQGIIFHEVQFLIIPHFFATSFLNSGVNTLTFGN